MLERTSYGGDKPIVAVCDKCDHRFNTGHALLPAARTALKRAGWHLERLAHGYVHYCASCAAKRYKAK